MPWKKSESIDQRRKFALKAVGTLNFSRVVPGVRDQHQDRLQMARKVFTPSAGVSEKNRERPHGALGMRCSAKLYRDSNRSKARGGVMNQLQPSWAKGYPVAPPGVGRPQLVTYPQSPFSGAGVLLRRSVPVSGILATHRPGAIMDCLGAGLSLSVKAKATNIFN